MASPKFTAFTAVNLNICGHKFVTWLQANLCIFGCKDTKLQLFTFTALNLFAFIAINLQNGHKNNNFGNLLKAVKTKMQDTKNLIVN